MNKVLLVSDHPNIGAIVETDNGMVAFRKHSSKGLIDLSTAHQIGELPHEAIYRTVKNETLTEAAEAMIENRLPRWTLPII